MGKGRLEGLDLLRGIAAVMVVFLHVTVAYPRPTWLFYKSYLAVDFFFMLSGYVLTRTYHARFAEGLGAGAFLLKRVRRLWPVIAVGTVLGLLAQLGLRTPEQQVWLLALGLAFIPSLAALPVFPLNNVVWSIFFELFANLFHASVLARISRTLLLALACVMAGVMWLCASHVGNFDLGSFNTTFVYGFPRVLLSYTIGCWLCLAVGDRPSLAAPAWLAPVALPALLIGGGLFDLGGWGFDMFAVVVAFPAILIAGLADLGRARPIGAFLGQLSFPLYAVHLPIVIFMGKQGLPWQAFPPVALFAAWLLCLATGTLPIPSMGRWRKPRITAEPA
jgi:peptidoglycan/LPS O-acetylase OafA/YrhL